MDDAPGKVKGCERCGGVMDVCPCVNRNCKKIVCQNSLFGKCKPEKSVPQERLIETISREECTFGCKYRFNTYEALERYFESQFDEWKATKKKSKVIGLVLYVF